MFDLIIQKMEFLLLYVEPITRTLANGFINTGIWLWLELNSIVIGMLGLILWTFSFGWVFVAMLLFGLGSTVAYAEQKKIFDTLQDGVSVITDSWNDFSPTIRTLLECVEPVFVFFNFVLEILSQVTFIVTKALNELNPDFQILFEWAERDTMENYLTRLEAQKQANELAETMLLNAEVELKNMTEFERRHYLNLLEIRINKISDMRRNDKRFLSIQAVCVIIEEVGKFLINLIEIVRDFFLNFVDFIADKFFDLQDGITANFVKIIVEFLISEILDQIPFAQCFVRIPQSIFECLCPWVYKSPLINFPNFNGNEEVPDDPIKALIGCICVLDIIAGSVDINDPSQDAIGLLFECLGIDILIDVLETILGWITSVLQPIFKALQTAYNILRGIVDGLFREIERILDLIDDICSAIPGCKKKRDQMERDEDSIESNLRYLRGRLEHLDGFVAMHMNEEKTKDMLRQHLMNTEKFQILKSYMGTNQSRINTKLKILADHVMKANSTYGRFNREFREQLREYPMSERFADRAENYSRSQRFEEYKQYATHKYGEDGAKHAGVIAETVRTALKGIATVARNGHTTIRHELKELNVVGFVKSVNTLAERIRAHDGYEESNVGKKTAMRVQMLRASIEGGDAFPRTAKYLAEKYGYQDKMLFDTVDEMGNMFRQTSPGSEYVRSALLSNNTYEFEFQLLKTRLGILRQNVTGYQKEVNRLREMYDNTERDPLTATILVGANAITALTSLGASVVAPLIGNAPEDMNLGRGANQERVVPIGLVFALAPLLFLAQVFITPIIGIITTVAGGLSVRLLDGDNDAYEAQVFDFFYPFYLRFREFIEYSFIEGQGLSLDDATDVLGLLGDDLDFQLETTAIYFVRNYMCPLPNFLCPPVPLVNRYGLGVQGIFEWGRNTVIFCNPEEFCAHTDEFTNTPCRCPVSEFEGDNGVQKAFYRDIGDIPKQRYSTKEDQCVFSGTSIPRGRRQCYPFVATGVQFPDLNANATFTTNCAEKFDLYVDEAAFYKADSFFQFIWANFYNTLLGLRHILRYAYRGVYVNWYLIFLIAMVAIVPCPCFSLVAWLLFIILFGLNIGSLLTTRIGTYADDITDINKNAFLFGPAFDAANDQIRFKCGDYNKNIFGDACEGENVCMLGALATSGTFTMGWLGTGGISMAFFWILGLPALIYGIVHVFIIVPYLIFLVLYMYYFSIFLYQKGIIQTGVIIEDVDPDHVSGAIKHIGSPVHDNLGTTIVHKTRKVKRRRPRKMLDQIMEHSKMVLRSLPLVCSENFYKTAKAYNPMTNDSLPHDGDEHTYSGFPYYSFIADHEGTPLAHSRHYEIHHTHRYKQTMRETLKED